MSNSEHAQREECLMDPPLLDLPIYMLILPYLFSSEHIFEVWNSNLYINATFLSQRFLLFFGWWKNKVLPFIYNVKFKKKNKKALLCTKKPQCCLYEFQTNPLDKMKFCRQKCNFSVLKKWDDITIVSTTLFVFVFPF